MLSRDFSSHTQQKILISYKWSRNVPKFIADEFRNINAKVLLKILAMWAGRALVAHTCNPGYSRGRD
jgi:hypothetical protein